MVFAAERVPAHFDIAIGGHFNRARRRRLAQRQAQRLAAKHIPVLYSRPRLQPNKLVSRLV
jgi:hypothetical protein